MKKVAIFFLLVLSLIIGFGDKAKAATTKDFRAMIAEEKSKLESGCYKNNEALAWEKFQLIRQKVHGLAVAKMFKYKKEVTLLQRLNKRILSSSDYCSSIDASGPIEDILGSGLWDEVLPDCVLYLRDLMLETLFDCPKSCLCDPDPIWCLSAQYGRLQTIMDLIDCA